jgi:hypothetical protein
MTNEPCMRPAKVELVTITYELTEDGVRKVSEEVTHTATAMLPIEDDDSEGDR